MSTTSSRPAPPKPWEKAGAGTVASSLTSSAAAPGSGASSLPAGHPTSGDPARCPVASSGPALPPRPADMTSGAISTLTGDAAAAASSALTSSAYNSSYANRMGGLGTMGGYGGYGSSYGGAYSSPYSRFGGGYGGYGGYGGGYGGYGASPYGFGAPAPGDMSLTRQMEAGTQATFQLIQSVVSAFGGFAQMLESTFMATHSSFFAMIGVAEQLTNLRNWLGEILSVFTLWRFLKRLIGRGDSGSAAATAAGMTAAEFADFERSGRVTPLPGQAGSSSGPAAPKPSKKPLIIFFLTVVGLPWLMSKLVKLITARQEAEARRLGLPDGVMPPLMGPDGQPLPQHMQPPGVDLALIAQIQQQQANGAVVRPEESILDPSKLTFVRATHSYSPTNDDGFELAFEKNDIIAVLTPKQERQDPGWWRGRLRNGKVGWFPSTHVQEVPMNSSAEKGDADKKA